jgi:hypothetical protein
MIATLKRISMEKIAAGLAPRLPELPLAGNLEHRLALASPLPSAARGRVREGAEASVDCPLPPHTIPRSMRSSRRSVTATMRRGISLLEVLIAVFVLTFGLLGIAMVIPAGRALMVEASKSDRGSACGRAALNDVQIRHWYSPSPWRQKWGGLSASFRSAIVNANEYSDFATGEYLIYDAAGSPDISITGLIYGETYFLDPYFTIFDTNDGYDSIRHFPYASHPFREFGHWGNGTGMHRRQWPERVLARRVAFNISEPLAERLTTWADELIFSLESDDARPRQTFISSDGQGWAYPLQTSDGATAGAVRLRTADEGRFTWAAMINPIVPAAYQGTWDHDNDGNATSPGIPLVNPTPISQYEVSIVVFYKRNLYCPTAAEIRDATDAENIRERSMFARLDGGGVGGGDVLLFVTGDGTGTTSVPANPPAGYLKVKKNQWIMLKALDRARPVFTRSTGPGVMETRPTVCKWYRVVAVDDVQPGIQINDPSSGNVDGSVQLQGRGRYVTLAGPDWQVDTTVDTATTPTNFPRFRPESDIAEAALVDDVVGVYTTIIDVNSL